MSTIGLQQHCLAPEHSAAQLSAWIFKQRAEIFKGSSRNICSSFQMSAGISVLVRNTQHAPPTHQIATAPSPLWNMHSGKVLTSRRATLWQLVAKMLTLKMLIGLNNVGEHAKDYSISPWCAGGKSIKSLPIVGHCSFSYSTEQEVVGETTSLMK